MEAEMDREEGLATMEEWRSNQVARSSTGDGRIRPMKEGRSTRGQRNNIEGGKRIREKSSTGEGRSSMDPMGGGWKSSTKGEEEQQRGAGGCTRG